MNKKEIQELKNIKSLMLCDVFKCDMLGYSNKKMFTALNKAIEIIENKGA